MVAIAVLSRHDSNLLENTLLSYRKHGLLSLIKEKLIFIQAPDLTKQKIAKKYGFEVVTLTDNQNISNNEAWKILIRKAKAKYVLMLEDDYPIIETKEEIFKQLCTSIYLLKHNKVTFVRLIHSKQPGKDFDLANRYKEFYPYQSNKTDFMKFIKRKIHSNDSQKLIGASVYVHKQPEKIHPHEVIRYNDHCFITSSKYMEWSNHSIFINKEWMLRLIDKAKPTFFGQQDLEKFLAGHWWREQNFPVAVCKGLFTHHH